MNLEVIDKKEESNTKAFSELSPGDAFSFSGTDLIIAERQALIEEEIERERKKEKEK